MADRFPVSCAQKAIWFRQRNKGMLIADMDALRIAMALKGSAGIRPCLWCLNCIGKHVDLSQPGFYDISEADMAKFQKGSDADIFAAADSLKNMVESGQPQKKIHNYEKALGLNYIPTSLLFDREAGERLPPSMLCVDGMHTVLNNGCASWEIAMLHHAIQRKTPFKLEQFARLCLNAQWSGPRCCKHGYNSYMRGLWNSKLFGENNYKGQAAQVESLVPLMRYLVVELLSSCDEIRAEMRSFLCLADTVSELRKLKFMLQITSPDEVTSLDALQCAQQRAFLEAYGNAEIKPKHHHRRHLPAAFLTLQLALRCEQHEAKHRSYKNGLAERFRGQVNRNFAMALLPRMLASHCHRLEESPRDTFLLLHSQSAKKSLIDALKDASLKTGVAIQRFHVTTYVNDIIFYENDNAAVVTTCLHGDSLGFAFALRKLRLVGRKGWGTIE
jgi:hypothetical protein